MDAQLYLSTFENFVHSVNRNSFMNVRYVIRFVYRRKRDISFVFIIIMYKYNVLRFSIIINFSTSIITIMSIPLVIIHNFK